MENQSTSIESLWERIRDYIETRAELLKLKAIDKASGVISGLITRIVLIILFVTFLGLLNIGLAIWVGTLLGQIYYGFFIIAAFYGIAGLVIYVSRKTIIRGPINDAIIKKLMD